MVLPALSGDGHLIADVVNANEIQIHVVTDRVINATLSWQGTRNVPLTLLQWAPISGDSNVRTLLAVAGQCLVLQDISIKGTPRLLRTVADLEFPASYGKICAAEFIFDHDAILLIFEHNSFASILSLKDARRDDIANRKFAGPQCFATRLNEKSNQTAVALILREKHADQIAVFQNEGIVANFRTDTIDVQGIKWLPDQCPLLVLWDASTYGPKILFYTATGQLLRQLTLSPETEPLIRSLPEPTDVGVLHTDCSKFQPSVSTCSLAFALGEGIVITRKFDSRVFSTIDRVFDNSLSSDIRAAVYWTQVGHDTYEQSTHRPDIEVSKTPIKPKVWLDTYGTKLAVIFQQSPFANFWSLDDHSLLASIHLEQSINGCFWLPESQGFILTTLSSTAEFYYWSDLTSPPQRKVMPRLISMTSKSWRSWLIHSTHGIRPRVLFAMANSSNFDIIEVDGRSFCSIFDRNAHAAEDESFEEDGVLHAHDYSRMTEEGEDMASSEHGSSIFF